MPARLAGLCRGASGTSSGAWPARVVDDVGAVEAQPPWTTRCRRRRGRRRQFGHHARRPAAWSVTLAMPRPACRPRRVDQPVLERRAARVETGPLSRRRAAWMAVMATVLTMSATVAPAEVVHRRCSPCSTGPTATAGRALHRLVRVVAGVEVREDEDGGVPGHLAARQLGARDAGVDRRVVLDRPLDRQVGPARTSSVAARTLSTSAPGPTPRSSTEHRPHEFDAERAAVSADESDAANCAAFGSGLTAQSP